MAQSGESKVLLMENAITEIYTHVEGEIASGTIDSANQDFEVTTAPADITGLVSGTPEAQYVNASDEYFRKDVFIQFRKDGKDTPVNTTTNAITISGTTISFATAPTPAEADQIVVSSSHTKSDRSDEITNMTPAGGARTIDYVTVQGGIKIAIQKTQEAKTIAFEVLNVDGGFVNYVNGKPITEVIAGESSGSDNLIGTVGAQTRVKRTVVLKVSDPETNNSLIELFYNVLGVSSEGNADSDGAYTENCTFECPPQDYCRLFRQVGQG